jgi:type IV pilus biogenesis protein CpaD/CtpE
MRSVLLVLLAASAVAGCQNPVAQEAMVDTRQDPTRADTMLAVGFRPGTGQLDAGQMRELQAMVAAGRAAERDEFVVVTDGSGGPIQQARAQQVMRSLSAAGARWVGSTVEPAMAMGPDKVVVVRSEYRLGEYNCPNYNPATIRNWNEATMAGFGCANAYNLGQMLARSRDAAVGRSPGPADATVNAAAIQRYHEGRVRTATAAGGGGTTGGSSGMGGTGGAGGAGTSGN